jgi:hypothetical protein
MVIEFYIPKHQLYRIHLKSVDKPVAGINTFHHRVVGLYTIALKQKLSIVNNVRDWINNRLSGMSIRWHVF